MYNENDRKSVEKYSSAVSLSDMEVFIFPELMFALVLANIMSPLLWKWLEDPWFRKMPKLSPFRRIHRAKQFIMDNFSFNLDLDTWGLTTKEKELARFKGYIDESVLSRSNALFGYEGDKYYFDIDIRKHFGLDKYTSNVIPYWKTETIEAMTAFKYKPTYPSGAGECVSFAALYASALWVTAKTPFEKIYMMATPLHSQNFVEANDGLLTNNRRIVTRNMWFNGSELSDKARRALENERVTVVVNNTGYIHSLYDEATMPPETYRRFSHALRRFLSTDITYDILASFLRARSKLQKCFQLVHDCCGKPRYIEAEKVYAYEHGSKARVNTEAQRDLLHEIDEDEYYTEPMEGRIILGEIESFFNKNKIAIDSSCDVDKLKGHLHHSCYNVEEVVHDLLAFARTEPKLPETNKKWVPQEPIRLDGLESREEVIDYLESIRGTHPVADLAFSAYRDMNRTPWKPFLKAAFERNPVSIAACEDITIADVSAKLWTMDNESIYDGTRMAQPDEVWNYGRGDGLEKAICLMNVINARDGEQKISITRNGTDVCVRDSSGKEYVFQSKKDLAPPIESDWLSPATTDHAQA